MHFGRRLAQALAITGRSVSSSTLRLQERSLRNLPRWYSTALNLHKDTPDNNPNVPWDFTPANMTEKLESIHPGLDKAILVVRRFYENDTVLHSAGEARNSAWTSGLSSASASQLIWRTPWASTTFARGYRSTDEKQKQKIRVLDDNDEYAAKDEPQIKDGDYDDDALEEQQTEDDDKYEVLDEQKIEDDDEEEDYYDDEEEEGRQAPVKKKSLFQQPKPKVEDTGPILNEKITATIVRLVDDDSKGHKVVSREEALYLAKEKQLDLVQVNGGADPPVCKIFDFNREQYKREQTLKERKKQKGAAAKLNEVKELRFTAKTEKKDLKMKVERAKQFLERGYRVKFVANFKGNMEDEEHRREQAKLIDSLFPMIEDVALIEQGPRVESRLAWVILRHVKFGKGRKKPPKPAKQSGPTLGVNDVKDEEASIAAPKPAGQNDTMLGLRM